MRTMSPYEQYMTIKMGALLVGLLFLAWKTRPKDRDMWP